MKRTMRIYRAVGLICMLACFTLISCEKSKVRSLTEMRQDERKRIKSFIASKGFKVKEAEREQKDFVPGILYHFDNDLYMEVLDKGGAKAVPQKTHVFMRIRGYALDSSEPVIFDSLSKGKYQPIEFIYIDVYRDGPLHFQPLPPAAGFNLNRYMCEGLAFPMSLLGDGARVRLIVPFSIGPEFTSRSGIPIYFDEVEYTF
ncbi:DUF4827 family protein [Porphyromonas crevioricanis]|uniref:Uncharacterized protein n=2 Tax=Porphyromonas crevioricanis TaxID=393921 RepID=A0A2X4PZN7_9PORP|nr:DUF4827 family protein [Porphyromonas crevioricanis]SQH73789.1 Uncharacterised protein [Porphyromonas crevioricanis]